MTLCFRLCYDLLMPLRNIYHGSRQVDNLIVARAPRLPGDAWPLACQHPFLLLFAIQNQGNGMGDHHGSCCPGILLNLVDFGSRTISETHGDFVIPRETLAVAGTFEAMARPRLPSAVGCSG